MNFKLKALVAAVALAAVAGSASAAIESTTSGVVASTTNTGGSELVFVVWDSVSKKSFTMDLGIQASSFDLGLTQSFGTITTGNNAAWASYSTLLGGVNTNSKWGVMAFRQGDNFTDYETWALSTVRTGKTFTGQSNGNLKGINTSTTNFINDANTEGHAGVGNFSDFSAQAEGNSYWGTSQGVKLGAKLISEFDNAIGTQANFWKLSAAGDNAVAPTLTQYGTWNFTTGGALSYTAAPIPEPETYSMLAAGLMLLGAVARRRLS